MTMNTSLKSTALEPGRGASFWHKLTSNYGMVVLTVLLFITFAALRPDTFASLLNFQLLASGKSVLLILALMLSRSRRRSQVAGRTSGLPGNEALSAPPQHKQRDPECAEPARLHPDFQIVVVGVVEDGVPKRLWRLEALKDGLERPYSRS